MRSGRPTACAPFTRVRSATYPGALLRNGGRDFQDDPRAPDANPSKLTRFTVWVRSSTDGEPMDLTWSPTDIAFRDEVRAFLQDKLTPELRRAGRLMTSVYSDHEA